MNEETATTIGKALGITIAITISLLSIPYVFRLTAWIAEYGYIGLSIAIGIGIGLLYAYVKLLQAKGMI